MIATVFGLVGSLWLVGHGLAMQISFSPTTENVERGSAGRWLVALGVIGIVASVAGFTVLRRQRILLGVFALLLVPAGEVWAARATSPSSGDIAALKEFDPPASFTDDRITDNGRAGTIERWWRVDGMREGVACDELEAALTAWADDRSVVRDESIRSCYLTATRNGHDVTALVVQSELDGPLLAQLLYEP